MKKLLSFIAKSIIALPNQLVVSETKEGQRIKLIISLPKEEISTIIGRQGRIIKAIKTILALKAKGKQFSIEVKEN